MSYGGQLLFAQNKNLRVVTHLVRIWHYRWSFFGYRENHRITPVTRRVERQAVSDFYWLKTLCVPLRVQVQGSAVSRLNGSRDPASYRWSYKANKNLVPSVGSGRWRVFGARVGGMCGPVRTNGSQERKSQASASGGPQWSGMTLLYFTTFLSLNGSSIFFL